MNRFTGIVVGRVRINETPNIILFHKQEVFFFIKYTGTIYLRIHDEYTTVETSLVNSESQSLFFLNDCDLNFISHWEEWEREESGLEAKRHETESNPWTWSRNWTRTQDRNQHRLARLRFEIDFRCCASFEKNFYFHVGRRGDIFSMVAYHRLSLSRRRDFCFSAVSFCTTIMCEESVQTSVLRLIRKVKTMGSQYFYRISR